MTDIKSKIKQIVVTDIDTDNGELKGGLPDNVQR